MTEHLLILDKEFGVEASGKEFVKAKIRHAMVMNGPSVTVKLLSS